MVFVASVPLYILIPPTTDDEPSVIVPNVGVDVVLMSCGVERVIVLLPFVTVIRLLVPVNVPSAGVLVPPISNCPLDIAAVLVIVPLPVAYTAPFAVIPLSAACLLLKVVQSAELR